MREQSSHWRLVLQQKTEKRADEVEFDQLIGALPTIGGRATNLLHVPYGRRLGREFFPAGRA